MANPSYYNVVSQITNVQLIEVVCRAVNDRYFRYQEWSLGQAEKLRQLAKRIEQGYADQEGK